MTEHMCEYDGSYFGDGFQCIECGKVMSVAETIRRFNATERLSAEWVRVALEQLEKILATDAGFLADLKAYANILEGKDD